VPDPAGTAPEQPGAVRDAVLWSYVLTAGRIGITTLVTFVLAALLGPAEFGVLAMAMLGLTLIQTLLQQGLISAVVQRQALTDDHLDAVFVVLLIGGAGFGVIMAALGPVLAGVMGEPQLTVVCLALAPLVPVHALMVVPEAVLRRALRFRAIAARTLLAAGLSGVAGIALALAGAGIWALIVQQLMAGIVGLAVLWSVCRWRPSRHPRLSAIRDLRRFSAHSASAGIALWLGSRADQAVTAVLFGPVAVGIYWLSVRLPEMVADVSARSLQQVALPALARLQGDRTAFAARLGSLQHLAAVTGLPLLGLLAGAAEPLVSLLGPQWAGTEVPLRLLCLYSAASVYGVVLGPALQAIGHPGRIAALAWARGLLGAIAFVAVGVSVPAVGASAQAASIAVAAIGVQALLVGVAVHVTRRTVAEPSLRLVTPTLPAALAALAAAGLPTALDLAAIPEPAPLVRLLGYGAAAGLLAAAILWLADHRLRTMVRARLGRGRGTGAVRNQGRQ
jgi:PST family polysaccharide transporter